MREKQANGWQNNYVNQYVPLVNGVQIPLSHTYISLI